MTNLFKRKLDEFQNECNSPLLDKDCKGKKKDSSDVSQKQTIEHCHIPEKRKETITSNEIVCDSFKERAVLFLQKLMKHIFALPFIKENSGVVRDECKNIIFLEDVCEIIENGQLNDLEEFAKYVNEVFDSSIKFCDGNLNLFGKKLFYKTDDLKMMANELRKELEAFKKEEISRKDASVTNRWSFSNDGYSEIIEKGENDERVFQKLKACYSNVPDHILLAKAFDISFSHQVDFHCIETELKKHEQRKAFNKNLKVVKSNSVIKF